jgi:hypothetical protein
LVSQPARIPHCRDGLPCPASDGAVQLACYINVVIMTPLSDDPMVELMDVAA